MNNPPLQIVVSPPIATILFDQPDSKVNVLTREMWLCFQSALRSISSRKDLTGLILRSAKPGIFLAGADLKELYPRNVSARAQVEEFIELGKATLDILESLPFPTVALIDGACLGGGLEVGLACDLCIEGSHPKKRLGLPEVQLGLIPGWGGTQRLSRLLGFDLARTLIGSGIARGTLFETVVDSNRLQEVALEQLVNQRDHLLARRTIKFASIDASCLEQESSDSRSHAVQEALRVIREGATLPLRDALEVERKAFLDLVPSEEAQRLIGEFLNRKPTAK